MFCQVFYRTHGHILQESTLINRLNVVSCIQSIQYGLDIRSTRPIHSNIRQEGNPMEMKRSSGILMHPSSLPGPAGMGDIGPGARAFIHDLAEAGQSLWQILPLGPTGYGDSPYAPLSSFAGNELLISLELLAAEGFLKPDELAAPAFSRNRVEYGRLITWKCMLLDLAAARFPEKAAPFRKAAYVQFKAREKSWLEDYALFRAIKDSVEMNPDSIPAPWYISWPKPLAERNPAALEQAARSLADKIEIYKTLQFFFAEQWKAVKIQARSAGVKIIGDLPIFIAADSADVWANPELFALDSDRKPLEVAGVPPDYFSAMGQLWGNPLYDWDAHRRENFSWWKRRLASILARHDIVRIDHFRGFESYYAVPAGAPDARNGVWRPGPGREFFEAISAGESATLPVIAEDLGFITPEVQTLRDSLEFPGMKILQFAFDSHESGTAFDPTNGFLPHNYPQHSVVYTGTHDNDTVSGWWNSATVEERRYFTRYCGARFESCIDCAATSARDNQRRMDSDQSAPASDSMPGSFAGPGAVPEAFIEEAMKSVAAWAILPMQDVLGLGSESRMNKPSTTGGNWQWRMEDGAFSPELKGWLSSITSLYGRNTRQ